MTILKKISVLSIALIAATIIGVGLDAALKWHNYGREFIDGFEKGYKDARIEYEAETQAQKDYQSIQANNAADTEGLQMDNTRTPFLNFLFAVGEIALCITIFVAFLRLVINYIGVIGIIRRGEVFSEDLEWRTNHIGIGLIVIYVAEWLLAFLAHSDAIGCPSFGVLCCGIGLMIVAQIFALGRNIKEDQEFMV